MIFDCKIIKHPLQVAVLVSCAAIAAISVLVYSKAGMTKSVLIRNDDSDISYLGELWRTKSSTENVLGSLAMTPSVGQKSLHRQHSTVDDKKQVSFMCQPKRLRVLDVMCSCPRLKLLSDMPSEQQHMISGARFIHLNHLITLYLNQDYILLEHEHMFHFAKVIPSLS